MAVDAIRYAILHPEGAARYFGIPGSTLLTAGTRLTFHAIRRLRNIGYLAGAMPIAIEGSLQLPERDAQSKSLGISKSRPSTETAEP